MTTAFVLTGGGSLGAIQVGMLQALAAHHIEPDILVGTSAGALNAAWVATHGMSTDSLSQLGSIWTGLRRSDIFPLEGQRIVRGLLGLSPAVTSASRLARLVTAHTPIQQVEDAIIPVHLVAADVLSGHTVAVSSGPFVTGILASAAIPGIFPPVVHEGRYLVDGGIAPQTGVAQAVGLGATVIYVLPAGAPCALTTPPRSTIGMALHAVTLLIAQRVTHEVADHAGSASIKVLPPLCPLSVAASDFRHAAELIQRGRNASDAWIDSGDIDRPAPHRFIGPHHHGGGGRSPDGSLPTSRSDRT
jgi:NTE family protein